MHSCPFRPSQKNKQPEAALVSLWSSFRAAFNQSVYSSLRSHSKDSSGSATTSRSLGYRDLRVRVGWRLRDLQYLLRIPRPDEALFPDSHSVLGSSVTPEQKVCALVERLLAARSYPFFIVGDILVLEISLSISDSYLPRRGRVGTRTFHPL